MKRLLDDPNLQLQLRDDLRGSRIAGESYDVAAKLPLLRSVLADASPTPAEAAAGDTMADTSRLQWSQLGVAPWTWKLALLALAAGASLFALWPADRDTRSEPAVIARPPVSAPSTQTPPVAASKPAPEEPEPARAEEPAPRSPEQQPQANSSRREISQLVRIRALLDRDPRAAYRLAQRSEREFPGGVLSEERQALQVIALAKSGAREDARRKAAVFFARYPESPMREHVESALK